MIVRKSQREEEFRVFFESEAERLRRLALWLTGDVEAAPDLAQESLVRTYRHWGRIRNGDAAPYARRVLVNLVRSSQRRRIIERRYLPRSAEPPRETSDRVADWMQLAEALRGLPPVRRATVVLRYFEDMTEAEIAATLDRPLGTVKSDIHRSLKALRTLLEEESRDRT
ncbi:MAG: SigE family RNA polymerase sigma factor [Actinomycetota bacterium]|nr:SigE family RNA polymerase sigma factor [Actinomycetota bacterium]